MNVDNTRRFDALPPALANLSEPREGTGEMENAAERTALIFPAYSFASSSMSGAIIRHGPHHGAQKSTRTGIGDLSTTSSKVASVTGVAAAAWASDTFSNSRLSADQARLTTWSDSLWIHSVPEVTRSSSGGIRFS